METLNFKNITISIRKITPANAAKILEFKNTKNRPITIGKVNEYVNSMKNDEWLFNGDSIRISTDGVLLDGQHRLTAVAKSGISQSFIVVENMQKSIGLTIDTGKLRNAGDVLALESGVSANWAASIGGAIKIFHKHSKGLELSNSGTGKLTNTKVVEEYKKNKELVVFCCDWFNKNMKGKAPILTKSEILSCLMIFANIDKKDCISFCKMVFCGVGVEDGSVQSFIRNYLLSCKVDTKKANQTQRLHSIIKSWNLVRAGKSPKQAATVVFRKDNDKFKKAF